MKNLTVDFSGLKFNLKKISESRLLSQYSQSKVLKLLLGAFTSEIQELMDAIVLLMEYRTLNKASGKQLDILGKIIGQPRTLFNYETSYWFAPEDEEVAPDNGRWWSNPAEKAVIKKMDDVTYRKRLWLQILKNHNKFSSNLEIKDQMLQGTGETIGIQVDGIVSAKLLAQQTISLTNYNLLDYYKDTQQADNDFYFAYPATTVITSVEKV